MNADERGRKKDDKILKEKQIITRDKKIFIEKENKQRSLQE